MSFSRLSSVLSRSPSILRSINPSSIPVKFNRSSLVPILIQFNRNINMSSTRKHAAPTAYEADKDYWSLKTTIDDVKAKYGMGGNRIKDPNLESNSDLDLEVDLTVADVKKLVKIQQLLEGAARDLSLLVSASPPEIFNSNDDEQVAIKANSKKLWLVEDDDVSGYSNQAIKNFRENRVAGDVDLNAYTLEEGKEEKTPVGFRQDLYSQ